MTAVRFALATLLALAATAAHAQDADLCADRPGKGTPACVVDPGTVQIETSLVDWSRTDSQATREDDLLFGDTLVKYGLGGAVELHAAFTAYEHDHARDRAGTAIADGFGDISLGARWRAIDGDDRHVSIALQPMVTLPVGNRAVSQRTWSVAVVAPIDLPLSGAWSANLSPTIAASADQDGEGRHLAYGGAAGLSYQLTDQVTLGGELWAQRDDDPAGHQTQASADLTLAWQPAKAWQLTSPAMPGSPLQRPTSSWSPA